MVYTFRRLWGTPPNYYTAIFPFLENMKNVQESVYIDPDDPATVVVKTLPAYLSIMFQRTIEYVYIVPEGFTFKSWRDVIGTGPFLVTDYLAGSSITYKRNPNYWRKDVFHPENQLPYLDGVKTFIIADLSTRGAALRTGKIDILDTVSSEDAEALKRSNPELKGIEYLAGGNSPFMRHDVKPFDDVRVRRAMNMATNKQEILEEYYGGKGVIFYYPGFPIPEDRNRYVPLEQMPASVQELYTYNPDKAAKLLDEAGYPGPNRFTTSITVSAVSEELIDLAALVAAYWAKVGVTLKIDVKEQGVYAAMLTAKTYPHGVFMSPCMACAIVMNIERKGAAWNYAMVDDPKMEEVYQTRMAAFFDPSEYDRIIRESMRIIHERAYWVVLPMSYQYVLWQPWLKAFDGAYYPSYMGPNAITGWVWIDQALKQSMGR